MGNECNEGVEGEDRAAEAGEVNAVRVLGEFSARSSVEGDESDEEGWGEA